MKTGLMLVLATVSTMSAVMSASQSASNASHADVIEARQIVLKDLAGRVRAKIGCEPTESGTPRIELFDTSGTMRLTLSLEPTGEGFVRTVGSDLQPRAELVESEFHCGGLGIYGPRKNSTMCVFATAAPVPPEGAGVYGGVFGVGTDFGRKYMQVPERK